MQMQRLETPPASRPPVPRRGLSGPWWVAGIWRWTRRLGLGARLSSVGLTGGALAAGAQVVRAPRRPPDPARLHQERRRWPAAPSAASLGGEVAAALAAARRSYLVHPGDDEQAARAIVERVNWSLVRARWFVSVNRDTVRRDGGGASGRHLVLAS
jgi:hypothetical protein